MDSKIVACGLHQTEEGTELKRCRSFPVRTNDTKTNLEVRASRLSISEELLKENEEVCGGKDSNNYIFLNFCCCCVYCFYNREKVPKVHGRGGRVL